MVTKKFLTNLDFVQNELQNAVIQVLASDPVTGKLGQIYYNSTIKALMQYDGAKWNRVGVVYQQDSTTGAVITGLDASGNVTVTNVTGLTLTGYTPVEDGYVTADMTMEQAMQAMDTAIKNAVAGGGEVNQNAWSKISIPAQSTADTAVAGQITDTTLSSDAKVDTFTIKTGNKWVDINGSGKTVNIGHSLSGVTAGTTGSANSVPAITVDAAGHITKVEAKAITAEAIGAATTEQVEVAQNAATAAQASADAKVASVGATENGGVEIGGTKTTPTVGIKLDPATGNAATLGAAGLMVTIPEVAIPEYSIAKLDTATEGYIATYQLQKDGTQVGVTIDIPKDMVVSSGTVETKAEAGVWGVAGTYLILTLANATSDKVYINVGDLIEYVTSGSKAGDMVEIKIDAKHKVTAVINDGTITKAKLVKSVQDSLALADSALQAAALEPYAKTADVESGYVAKETGKRLMTNAEGTKLSGIATGAQVNKIEAVKVGGTALEITDKAVDITAISTDLLTQGTMTLVLNGGNAATLAAE